MTKYVKKAYEVLSGEIDKEPPPTPYVAPVYNHQQARAAMARYDDKRLPMPGERYKMVKEAQELGFRLGTKVMRVGQVSEKYIDSAEHIGEVVQFLFVIWPNWSTYMPLLVQFNNKDGSDSKYPFLCSELETWENAKKIVELEKGKFAAAKPMQQLVIEEIMQQRNGVIPFRQKLHPSTPVV